MHFLVERGRASSTPACGKPGAEQLASLACIPLDCAPISVVVCGRQQWRPHKKASRKQLSSQEVALSCSGSIMSFNSKLSKGLLALHGQMDKRRQED